VFSFSKKLKLNLNSRLVVIFVLRLAKPLSETGQRKLKSRNVSQEQAVLTWWSSFHHTLTLGRMHST